MTLASAWVTPGPLYRIEGTLPSHARRMIQDAGAFEMESQWFCKQQVWPRVEASLRAAGVILTMDESQVKRTATVSLENGRTGRVEGALPRKVDKTWLGRIQGRALTRISPYAFHAVTESMQEDGIEILENPAVRGMKEWMDEQAADIMAALSAPAESLPDVKLKVDTLRDYQRRVLAYGDACHGRFCLWDEVGLGKTLSSLAYAVHSQSKRVLIVCPAGPVKGQWRDEIRKNLGGEAFIVTGERPKPIPADAAWVITNPELLPPRYEDLAAYDADLIILDEAHKHRSPDGQRVKALRALALKSKRYIPLSGTPIENMPHNMWAQLDMCQPGFWGTHYDFGLAFCKPVRNHWASRAAGRDIFDFKGISQDTKPELLTRLRKVALRRTGEEVNLELPAQTRTILRMPLDAGARHAYKDVRSEYDAFIKDATKDATTEAEIMGILTAARWKRAQLALKLRKTASLGRVPQTVDYVEDLVQEGEKPILFGYYRDVLDALAEGLRKAKVKVSVIHGGITGDKRDSEVQAFKDGKTDVLVAQIEVGGTGLNLQHASRITVTHETSYIPIHLQQSEGRVYRSGQKRPVQHIYLLAEDTVEQRVLDILLVKMAAQKEVLDAEATGEATETEILRAVEADFFGAKG